MKKLALLSLLSLVLFGASIGCKKEEPAVEPTPPPTETTPPTPPTP